MKQILTILLLVQHLLLGLGGGPMAMPENDISIGPSYGIVLLDDEVWNSFNLDCSYNYHLFSLSINGKYHFLPDRSSHYALQVEATTYFFFALGGGVTWWWMAEKMVYLPHLFIGLPISINVPLFSKEPSNGGFFLHPYTRIYFLDDQRVGEFGIYIKFTTWDGTIGRSQRRSIEQDKEDLKLLKLGK